MRPETPHAESGLSFYLHIVIKGEAQDEFIATKPGRKFLKRIGLVDRCLSSSVQSGIARNTDDVAIEHVAVLLDHEVNDDASPLAKFCSRRNEPVVSHSVQHLIHIRAKVISLRIRQNLIAAIGGKI